MTLLEVAEKVVFSEELQYPPDMLFMLFDRLRVDEDVVNVDLYVSLVNTFL